MKKLMTAGLFVASLLSLQAVAQEPGGRPERPNPEGMFKKLDTDGDGKISKSEADASSFEPLKKDFDAIDMNADGFVTQTELAVHRKEHGEKRRKKKSA